MKQTPEERRLKHNAYMREYYRKLRANGMSPEQRERHRRWAKKYDLTRDPQQRRDEARRYRVNLRAEVLAHYGGRCVCCNESYPEFLTIDHIVPIKRKKGERQTSAYGLLMQIKREGFSEDYQVLCFNCNHAKGTKAECPHKRLDSERFTLFRLLSGGRTA